MEHDPKNSNQRPKRRVRRYSATRLLREKIPVRDGDMLSTERHRGQMMVRVESPDDER